jgi:diguanylate cyclase (GGDEF)-like protein
VGVVAVLALEATRWAALPLAVVAVLVVFAYRVYADLRERHDTVERLYRFSQVVTAESEGDQVLAAMLDHVCDMMRSVSAQLTFFVEDDRRADTEAVLRRGAELERRPPHLLTPDAAWVVDTLCDGQPVLLARATTDRAARHWLHVRGLRDAMLVPLRGEHGVIGALSVTDRLGESRGFDPRDLRLLETVANHASVALRHGRLVDRLRHDSLHDALTGAPNRAYLHLEIQRLLDALANDGPPFAVGMLDLNSFKDVNDTLGHQHGDAMLREVAERLTSTLAGRALVTRFGGDEFAVLFRDCNGAESASRLCRLMLDALRRPVDIDGTAVDVGASVGIALAPGHAETIEQLLKRADVAMYVAKQSGRDIVVFDPAHETTSPSRLALAAALRQAVADRLIGIHVQPQMSLSTGRVTSVEALARWTDAERGAVGPDEFIALAERTGLIGQLTDVVLDKAIAACAGWQRFAPGVSVAVNLSARSLRDEAFADHVDRVLRHHRLPATLLTLEITESSVMADPASTLGLLHRLRDRGIRLSIDDFGTGYSSLAYLRRLPVQEVKVDRAFVQRMDTESDDAAIVGTIVDLAHTLELDVVAEGIENAAVAALLRDLGCETGQGFHFAPPMPVEAFAAWMASAPQPRRGHRLLAIAGDG